jgi:hypothetical protein
MIGVHVWKTVAVCLLLSGAVLVPAARADLLYDVNGVTTITHIPYEYSFTEPDFLTTTHHPGSRPQDHHRSRLLHPNLRHN